MTTLTTNLRFCFRLLPLRPRNSVLYALLCFCAFVGFFYSLFLCVLGFLLFSLGRPMTTLTTNLRFCSTRHCGQEIRFSMRFFNLCVCRFFYSLFLCVLGFFTLFLLSANDNSHDESAILLDSPLRPRNSVLYALFWFCAFEDFYFWKCSVFLSCCLVLLIILYFKMSVSRSTLYVFEDEVIRDFSIKNFFDFFNFGNCNCCTSWCRWNGGQFLKWGELFDLCNSSNFWVFLKIF
jgi:hypothetical protein